MAGDDSEDPGHPDYWRKLLAESSAQFEAMPTEKPSLETLRSLYTQVLRSYGYTCALTGATFDPPADFLHDNLEVVPIRPLTMGGSLHVDNFLCLERRAGTAFRQGEIAVGPSLELVADLSRIDPDLLERLNPLGRLLLPDPGQSRPDAAALAFHREHIFLRRS